jgi:hypothetical protein
MIVRFARTLAPHQFARKYPKPHVVVGHFDPKFVIDEEATGEPSLFTVLLTAKNTLDLVGECTGIVDSSSSTMRFSFALGEDAARFCALVRATPDKALGDCATMAFFHYDQGL